MKTLYEKLSPPVNGRSVLQETVFCVFSWEMAHTCPVDIFNLEEHFIQLPTIYLDGENSDALVYSDTFTARPFVPLKYMSIQDTVVHTPHSPPFDFSVSS